MNLKGLRLLITQVSFFVIFSSFFFVFRYKITHLGGNPHGPPLLLRSFFAAAPSPFVGAGLSPPPSSSFFAAAGASFPSPSCSQLLPDEENFTTAFQNSSPWMRATSSSLAVGWREPSAPAKVPAPQALPPWISVRSVSWAKVLA